MILAVRAGSLSEIRLIRCIFLHFALDESGTIRLKYVQMYRLNHFARKASSVRAQRTALLQEMDEVMPACLKGICRAFGVKRMGLAGMETCTALEKRDYGKESVILC